MLSSCTRKSGNSVTSSEAILAESLQSSKEVEKISFKCPVPFLQKMCRYIYFPLQRTWLWLKTITLRDVLKFIYSSVCLGWKKMRIEEAWKQIYPVYFRVHRKLIACIFSISMTLLFFLFVFPASYHSSESYLATWLFNIL